MRLSVRGRAWALCAGLWAPASAGAAEAEPPALCDARDLGEEARREYEAGVAALKVEAHEAVPPLRRALALEPRAAVVRMGLGSALAKAGQPEAAAREYAAFVSACPEHPRAGEILALLADYVRARGPSARTAPGASPAPGDVVPRVEGSAPAPAVLTAPAGAAPAVAPEGALCDARRLPASARARYQEGERYLREARFAQAARALRAVLALEPRAATAHLLLGSAHARLGEAAEGARAYAHFLAACPEHPRAPTVRKLLAGWREAR